MSEEAIYDEGYYNGVKDALQTFLLMHMEAKTLVEIRESLVNMRSLAKNELEESKIRAGYDEEWDDED